MEVAFVCPNAPLGAAEQQAALKVDPGAFRVSDPLQAEDGCRRAGVEPD